MYYVSSIILVVILFCFMHVLIGEVVDRASTIPRTKTEHPMYLHVPRVYMVDSFFLALLIVAYRQGRTAVTRSISIIVLHVGMILINIDSTTCNTRDGRQPKVVSNNARPWNSNGIFQEILVTGGCL